LVIRNEIGDIRIQATDRKDVKITAIRRAHNSSESEGPSKVKELQVHVFSTSGEVRVTGTWPGRSVTRLFRGETALSLDFEVEVPRSARIEVQNNIGDIRVEGATSDVDVHENIGDVTVDFATGFHPHMVSLQTNIGDVKTNLSGSSHGWLGHKFTSILDGEHSLNIKLNIGDIHVHTDGSKDGKKRRKAVDL
jgi:hypothetical protein